MSEKGHTSHTIPQYCVPYSPIFHQNLPEAGMERHEHGTMTADGCDFMGILRTHVVTSCSITEILKSVAVFPQIKFCRVANFLKSSLLKVYSIKVKNFCWKQLCDIHVLCPYISVSYHIFELLPFSSLYHPEPYKLFPEICPL